jgi:hypothetical protein
MIFSSDRQENYCCVLHHSAATPMKRVAVTPCGRISQLQDLLRARMFRSEKFLQIGRLADEYVLGTELVR